LTSELVPVLAIVLLVPLEMSDVSLGEVCESRLADGDDMVGGELQVMTISKDKGKLQIMSSGKIL
jgi:hypothetical protein